MSVPYWWWNVTLELYNYAIFHIIVRVKYLSLFSQITFYIFRGLFSVHLKVPIIHGRSQHVTHSKVNIIRLKMGAILYTYLMNFKVNVSLRTLFARWSVCVCWIAAAYCTYNTVAALNNQLSPSPKTQWPSSGCLGWWRLNLYSGWRGNQHSTLLSWPALVEFVHNNAQDHW